MENYCNYLDLQVCSAAGSGLATADLTCPFTTVELLAEVVGAEDDMLSLEVTLLLVLAVLSG